MIRRGTVWPWVSIIDLPEGWAQLPGGPKYAVFAPIGIYALRDHDEPPRLDPTTLADFVRREERLAQWRAAGSPVQVLPAPRRRWWQWWSW